MTTPTSNPGSNIEVDLQATNPRTFDVSEDYVLEAKEGAIPDGLVDNFELESSDPAGPYASGETLSDYYAGVPNLSFYQIASDSSAAAEGGRYVENVDGQDAGEFVLTGPNDGLPETPTQNDTVSVLIQDPVTAETAVPTYHYSCEINGNGNVDGYGACLLLNNDIFAIRKYTDAVDPRTYAHLQVESVSANTGEWYWLEVDIPESGVGSHESRLYEYDQTNDLRGDLLATATATDDEHTGGSLYGFGKSSGKATGPIIDRRRIE